MNLRKAIAPVLLGAGVSLMAACHGTSTAAHQITPSQAAQAKQNAAMLARCLPTDPLNQIRWAKSLRTHSGRANLVAKCGIPAQNRAAAESAILGAAEHGHLTSPGGRAVFFNVTLPKILEQEQG